MNPTPESSHMIPFTVTGYLDESNIIDGNASASRSRSLLASAPFIGLAWSQSARMALARMPGLWSLLLRC